MYPFLLALNLFTTAPYSAEVQSATPITSHYVSSVGYVDLVQPTLPDNDLTWPTVTQKLTRGFTHGHTGLDIDARTGNAVYAAFTGTVTTVSHTGPYGNKIVISHPNHSEKISTLYAHLTDTLVSVGDTVTAGQTIGTVGSTGNSDGDHLHIEVLLNGVAVDPDEYF